MATAKDAYQSAMREDILGATERMLVSKGLAGLTVRDILDEAGVAPGTLYAYFSGKEELLETLARRYFEEYVRGLAKGGEASPQSPLATMTRLALSQPMEGGSVISDMRGRVGDSDHTLAVKKFNEDILARLLPEIDRAREAGQLRVDDGKALLELLDIIWDGMTRRSASDTFVTSYERVGTLALALLEASGILSTSGLVATTEPGGRP